MALQSRPPAFRQVTYSRCSALLVARCLNCSYSSSAKRVSASKAMGKAEVDTNRTGQQLPAVVSADNTQVLQVGVHMRLSRR